jgi:transposase InsO family protein
MKHIGGKTNCLADYLSRPTEDPLFDIDYGLESKLPLTATSTSDTSFLSMENVVSTMTLRPRPKPMAPSISQSSEFVDAMSDTVSCSSTDSIVTDALPVTTTPSPSIFDSNELQREQANDPEIRRIFDQLSNNPSDQSNLSSFLIKNNLLHRLVSLTARSTRKIAVPYLPSSMIKSLLTAMHDDPYQGGHFSTDKMISKISSRYWWPQMRKTISRHVKACALCQQYNHSRQKKPGHLRPITPTAIPFSIIGMDFCGPFPESPQGNKYILVITDLFTRFVTAIPLPKNTAELTALALFRHIFCRFGVCSTLITDQGTHFNNNLMRALTHLIGFNHILSTPYHPQTNGVVERFNASMVVQIAKLQQKHHNNWDDYLDAIVFAYNTSQHRSTKFSPFELLFGRSPHLPIDSPPRYFQFDRPNDHFLNLQKVLQVYHQQAKENSVNQQKYNKQHYDRNRSDPHYNIGDRVFTKIFSTRGKLDPRFSVDPHIVVRANHPTYIVRHEPSGVQYQYHVSDLRPVISALEDDSFL